MPNKNDDTLSMVEQLLSNEDAGVSPKKSKQKVAVKKKTAPLVPGELEINRGYNPDEPQEYWPGDTIKMTPDMIKRARLPDDAFLVCINTPTKFKHASVMCPWYSIFGWGETTRQAMDNCVENMAEYCRKYPDEAKKLLENYNPNRRSLKSLNEDARKSAADMLTEEGLY